MTPRDEIEKAIAAMRTARGWVEDGYPSRAVGAIDEAIRLARSALSRPAPATEAKCPRCGEAVKAGSIGRIHDPALDNATDEDGAPLPMNERWQPCPECVERETPEMDRLAAEENAKLHTTPRSEGEWRGDEAALVLSIAQRFAKRRCHGAVYMDGKHDPTPAEMKDAREVVDEIRALRPTPPPAEGVEAKRREFYEAAEASAEWTSIPLGQRGPVGSDLEEHQRRCDRMRATYAAWRAAETSELES